MNRTLSFVIFFLWSLIGLISPKLAHAQYPNGFETLCPAGAAGAAQPLSFGVSFDPNTAQSVAGLCIDARGNWTSSFFTSAAGSIVTSFNTRTGAVVPVSGDYTCAQVTGCPTGTMVNSFNGRTGAVVPTNADYTANLILSGTFPNGIAGATQAASNNSTLLATTAYVQTNLSLLTTGVSSVFGRTGAVTANSGDYGAVGISDAQGDFLGLGAGAGLDFTDVNGNGLTTSTAGGGTLTLPFANGGANVVCSNTGCNIPLGLATPTPTTGTNSTQVATTAYVVSKLASPTAIGSTAASTGAFTTLTYTQAKTTTKCHSQGTAANPSVATCSGAAAGVFSCAVAGSGNCLVTTSQVIDNNSTILLTQIADTTVGTLLGVTCNTTASTPPLITSRANTTSFTFTITTPITNPDCFQYSIVN